MSTDDDAKKKKAHGPQDILSMEDTIGEIAEKLKVLRHQLQTQRMPTVELMTGTFKFRAKQCLKLAKKFLAEYDTQATDYSVDRVRQETKDERTERSKKRS